MQNQAQVTKRHRGLSFFKAATTQKRVGPPDPGQRRSARAPGRVYVFVIERRGGDFKMYPGSGSGARLRLRNGLRSAIVLATAPRAPVPTIRAATRTGRARPAP